MSRDDRLGKPQKCLDLRLRDRSSRNALQQHFLGGVADVVPLVPGEADESYPAPVMINIVRNNRPECLKPDTDDGLCQESPLVWSQAQNQDRASKSWCLGHVAFSDSRTDGHSDFADFSACGLLHLFAETSSLHPKFDPAGEQTANFCKVMQKCEFPFSLHYSHLAWLLHYPENSSRLFSNGCPTWIRTMTKGFKVLCATFTPSGTESGLRCAGG